MHGPDPLEPFEEWNDGLLSRKQEDQWFEAIARSKVILEAAEIKAQHPIAYADAFIVATALREGALIVTGDPDFKKVEHLVSIEWMR